MDKSLFFRTDAGILCVILFVLCILMVMFGRFVRSRVFNKDQEESRGGVNSLLAALFGLWGFIIAFSFGSSSSRFDSISNTMIDEYNTIRNAIYRSELFPDSIRRGFEEELKNYIQARVDYYSDDPDKLLKATQDTRDISRLLWARTERAATIPNAGPAAATMFSTLTSMYDLAAKRDAMLLAGSPELIFYLLFFLALVVSFNGGFTTPVIRSKEWVIIISFIFLACIIIFITLDLSRPMRGYIKPVVAKGKIEQLQRIFLDKTK